MDGLSKVTELVHPSVRLTPGPRALHQQPLLHSDSEELVPRSCGCPASPARTEAAQGEGRAGWEQEVVSGRVLGCDSVRDGAGPPQASRGGPGGGGAGTPELPDPGLFP